jgi:hypothetical protein
LNFAGNNAVMDWIGNRAGMGIWRAIIVHALAACLLMVGVCPCAVANPVGAAVSGNAVSASRAAGACCCCAGMCDGKSCGMPCCRRAGERHPVPPAAPGHKGHENREHVVAVFCDVPALSSQCDAEALLRAASIAGWGCLPALTLQTQSVRIQT